MLKKTYYRCKPLVRLLVSFLTLWFVKCNTNINKIELIKLSEYDKRLPSLEDFLTELENVSIIECGAICLMNKFVCVGVFYNALTKFCKLPNDYPNKTMDYGVQPGWGFWNTECNSGWLYHSDHCYLLNHTQKSWHDAKLQCESNGAFLADINSAEENSWITEKLIGSNSTDQTWIGASDEAIEGIFIWSKTNSTLKFSNWREGEKNDFKGEDCLSITHNTGKWNDRHCSIHLSFICKKIT
ncbi:neurocan core protein-like [Saccostrea cucullata]|uniref:neurocan core protein-like n=1 Tax=Saccostrea cuccullata TaxID=36930 RepID=UPI002ED685A5